VRFYFTGTEILYDYNANLSKAVAAKRLPLTILCIKFNHNLVADQLHVQSVGMISL